MSNEIDFTNHYTVLKTMKLSHYEAPRDFMSDMHSQVDALNDQLQDQYLKNTRLSVAYYDNLEELEITKRQLEEGLILLEMIYDSDRFDPDYFEEENIQRVKEFLNKLKNERGE